LPETHHYRFIFNQVESDRFVQDKNACYPLVSFPLSSTNFSIWKNHTRINYPSLKKSQLPDKTVAISLWGPKLDDLAGKPSLGLEAKDIPNSAFQKFFNEKNPF